MNPRVPSPSRIERHVPSGAVCCDPAWEAAYNRFETPEQEVTKFLHRFRRFGLDRQPKSLRCLELFCGRGGGLVALERLGFERLAGVDLSESLLEQYAGPAELHLADCRRLPFGDGSFDVAIVQGGLHHLTDLANDLDAVLRETARVLCGTGRLYLVEPWQTPFLRFAHFVTDMPWVRRIYPRGDALAEMTEHERDTYEQWLGQPGRIRSTLDRHFEAEYEKIGRGKINYIGRPRE
jgi:SAM-dependent methyltransferase